MAHEQIGFCLEEALYTKRALLMIYSAIHLYSLIFQLNTGWVELFTLLVFVMLLIILGWKREPPADKYNKYIKMIFTASPPTIVGMTLEGTLNILGVGLDPKALFLTQLIGVVWAVIILVFWSRIQDSK